MGEVDLKGQALAEQIYTYVLTGAGIIGTAAGFVMKDFRITFLAILAGTLLCLLIVVPNWPFFRLDPIKFQPVVTSSQGVDQPTSPSSGSHRSKKKRD